MKFERKKPSQSSLTAGYFEWLPAAYRQVPDDGKTIMVLTLDECKKKCVGKKVGNECHGFLYGIENGGEVKLGRCYLFGFQDVGGWCPREGAENWLLEEDTINTYLIDDRKSHIIIQYP